MTDYEDSLIKLEALKLSLETYKFRYRDNIFKDDTTTQDSANFIVETAKIYERFILS